MAKVPLFEGAVVGLGETRAAGDLAHRSDPLRFERRRLFGGEGWFRGVTSICLDVEMTRMPFAERLRPGTA